MPEVSLVAILDADKEGFLRSEGSLIQTIGRAARNVKGKAILYADRVTQSMERAMAETERRRRKQLAYNEAHDIEPKSIRKPVQDIMEGARSAPRGRGRGQRRETDLYRHMSPEEVLRRIEVLEKRMYKHARDLEFEEAAKIRDEINEARRQGFGLSETSPADRTGT